MKKLFLILTVALCALNATAQNTATATAQPLEVNTPTSALKFGYFSYNQAMEFTADYALAQQNLKDLRA